LVETWLPVRRVRVIVNRRVACALVNEGSSFSLDGGASTKTAPPIAWMGGAARRVSAALLGALRSSHAQKPATNEAEGAAKEENVGAMHERELKRHDAHVKCAVDKSENPSSFALNADNHLEFSILSCRTSRFHSAFDSYSRLLARDHSGWEE